ncbi:MAG: ADP-ribosylglycohydrolase family protein [Rubripirellula sp.]
MDRRSCLSKLMLLCSTAWPLTVADSARSDQPLTTLTPGHPNDHTPPSVPSAPSLKSRVRGMLLGSLIGDALGGPIEFAPPERVADLLPNARNWPAEKVLNPETLADLATTLTMHSYVDLRPDTAPYGPWIAKAPAGTLTDDSRHKIVTLRALRAMLQEERDRLSPLDFAEALIAFEPHPKHKMTPELSKLVQEGMREYRYAARWMLGDRDENRALPVERLWAGIPNCSGQMALLPIAGIFPGQPERAYRETFAIDFIDAPTARDIAAALNAGLAAALSPEQVNESPALRWQRLIDSMRATDPYRFAEVPFVGRPLTTWMDRAEEMATQAKGSPRQLYEMLENEGKPVYYWDAHFTLLVPLSILYLCDFDPLASMNLVLDFGHDTDSYAQVLGAMAGAVHGDELFPASMIQSVQSRLDADYAESVEDWHTTLRSAAKVWSHETP